MSEPKIVTEALVEWHITDRKFNQLMINADLGLSGVGIKERMVIIYDTGEDVDEARVLAGVNEMIRIMDEEKHKIQIYGPKVISIRQVEKVLEGGKPETPVEPEKVVKSKARSKSKTKGWWNSKKGLI